MDGVPELIERTYTRKGAEGSALRALRNNLVFVAADDARKGDMRSRMFRRLALQALKQPERLADLADHQQDKVRELEARSEQELAIAVQQCYRHLFYPSRNRIEAAAVDLAHSAMDGYSASERPGEGQREIVRALRDLNKLRLAEDEPDSPAYVRDRTPLKKNGQITTAALRDEFRRDPALPMLSGDDIFIRGVRRGVELGEYVYRRGDLLFGPGDPAADIVIDERALVFAMAYARNGGIWPRQEKPKEDPTPGGTRRAGGGASATGGSGEKIRETREGEESRAGSFTAEGVLREALIKLWEQARNRDVAAIGMLEIRMFESGDGFRLLGHGKYEIWQLPAKATPRVAASARIAGLRGRNLELVEHRVLKRLAQAGVRPHTGLNGRMCGYAVTEDVALTLGLLFRTLAPMRSRDNMRAVAEGIENMGREEAAYWLGMAMHRRHPRRVLTALRFLLTEPRRRRAG